MKVTAGVNPQMGFINYISKPTEQIMCEEQKYQHNTGRN